MMPQTVLITGGFGFLGRATAREFKSRGFRVIGIGHGLRAGNESRSLGFDEWLAADVTMSSLLTIRERFDIVMHCAGNGSVQYAQANPLQDFGKTILATVDLLEYIRLKQPDTLLIYPSSAGVYGAKDDCPIKESDCPNPISTYGHHKKIVEELCENYSGSYGLRIALIRFFSIYGPGLTKQLLWDASLKLSSEKTEAIFWGTGEETRDWINIADATNLILKISENKDRFSIYNGASGNRVTVKSVLEMLRDELGSEATVKFNGAVREGDPRFYHADITKPRNLGWEPTGSLAEGIARYVEWFKAYRGN